MRTCPTCGGSNSRAGRVCRYCGAELAAAGNPLRRFLKWFARLSPMQFERKVITRTRVSRSGSETPRKETHEAFEDLESMPEEMRAAFKGMRKKGLKGNIEISGRGITPSVTFTLTKGDTSCTYKSIDEVPPDLRGLVKKVMKKPGETSEGITVAIDGEERTYSSLDEVPSEIRAMIEAARKQKPT